MNRIGLVVLVLALGACKKDESKKEAPKPKVTADAAPAPKVDGVTGDDGAQLQVRLGGDPDAVVPRVDFTIDAVHDKQKPTEAPPWHEAGGEWTFLDAKTAGGVPVVIGLHETRRLQSDITLILFEARLAVADRATGARLVDEMASALKVAAPPAGKGELPIQPLTLNMVVMGENVARNADGSFSGKGSWMAGEWTSEHLDDAAEVYFNFDLGAKRAELTGGDTDVFVAHVAALLRDGVAEEKAAE